MKFFLILSLGVISLNVYSAFVIIPKDDQVLTIYPAVESQPALYPFEIDVLVWNIYKGKRHNWKQDYSRLTEGKEIILLQESYLSSSIKQILSQSKLHSYVHATSWIDIRSKVHTGIVTGAVTNPIKSIWQRSFYREPIVMTPKMALLSYFPLAGVDEKLLVVNFHGINFVRAYKLRNMLDKAASLISKHPGPVIFAGDFNTWTQTKINNMQAVMKKMGLVAVNFKVDKRKRLRGLALDHIWIRGLKVLDARSESYSSSDHNPMEARLSLF